MSNKNDRPDIKPWDFIAVGRRQCLVTMAYGEDYHSADCEVIFDPDKPKNRKVKWDGDDWTFVDEGDFGGYAEKYDRLSDFVEELKIQLGTKSKRLVLDEGVYPVQNDQSWAWTKTYLKRFDDIKREINELQNFWPLTDRQVYYSLAYSPCINEHHWRSEGRHIDEHGELSRILNWMRINKRIALESIFDEPEIITEKEGFYAPDVFVTSELETLGKAYSRCKAQNQPRFIEVWLEKPGLLHIVKPVADEFCRRVAIFRDTQQLTFLSAFRDRAVKAMNLGKVPNVLYFSDWNPTSINRIYKAMRILTSELQLDGVEFHRCGLNPEHLLEIPPSPFPVRPDTSNGWFIDEHGHETYELDAFHPLRMQTVVRNNIQKLTDMAIYEDDHDWEAMEFEQVEEWSSDVIDYGAKQAAELEID